MAKEHIWDRVRKKRVLLTPEEGVRQWLVNKLNQDYNYPLNLMSLEHSISLNGVNYRCDLVVWKRDLKPLFIAECKAPNIKISQSTFDQIVRYNLALEVEYLLVTNGYVSYIAKITPQNGEYHFLTNIPDYYEISK